MLKWFEHRQVYHPSREMSAAGAEVRRPFEDVFFKSRDGVELNGWFFPAAPESSRSRFVILICHGNAGNISSRPGLYEAFLETGVGAFAFDYRGYGRSGGKPGEEGTYLDAEAAFEWLEGKGYDGRNVVLFGESLGGGVSSELCLRRKTGGLILQSTFTNIRDIGAELFPWLPVRWMNSIHYDTLAKLPRLKVPVLVMHSRTDDLIGFHHAERNFAAANDPKFFCELEGGHGDPPWESPAFREAIERFLRGLEKRAT